MTNEEYLELLDEAYKPSYKRADNKLFYVYSGDLDEDFVLHLYDSYTMLSLRHELKQGWRDDD